MEENLILIILLASGGMFLLVLAVVLFVITYQRKLLAQKLDLQHAEQAYQQELLQSSVTIMENERRRIAKDLHDEIGASLTALKIYTGQISQNPHHIAQIQQINLQGRKIIEQTIQNIRTITQDLLPATLDHFGLQIAIQETCDSLSIDPNFQIYFEYQLPTQCLEKDLELALYRIFRELLNNTYRHAEATQVKVFLHYLPITEEIRLIYQDNGKGFDFQGFSSPTYENGLGLKSIETRAKAIRGQIRFQSELTKGIEVEIIAPAVFRV